jgi:hypothetical protein
MITYINVFCAGMVVVINSEFDGGLVVTVEDGRRGSEWKKLKEKTA